MAGALAAGNDFAAFVFSDLDVRQDLVELLLRRLSTDHGVGVKGVTLANGGDARQHFFHKLRVNRFLNQGARRAGTDFTLVEEAKNQPLNRLVDEFGFRLHDVFKEDVRRFTAQLHGAGNDIFRRTGQNMAAYRG
ncbi:hypothetical protein D3C87_1752010 [compost metagenome]